MALLYRNDSVQEKVSLCRKPNRRLKPAEDRLIGDGTLTRPARFNAASPISRCVSTSELGFEGVRQVAIDEDWSALRFRRAEYIRTMRRDPSRAMSAQGRRKVDEETGKR
jgi:hypothetical protein